MKTNWLRFIKINTRIILILLGCIAVSSVCVIVLVENLSRLLTERYLFQYIESTQAATGRSLELINDEAAATIAGLLERVEICDLFARDLSYARREHLLKALIKQRISNLNIIGNLTIIDNQGVVYDRLIPEAEISYQYTPFLEKARASIHPIWGFVRKGAKNDNYLEFGQKFRNYKNGEVIGTLLLYIKESALYHAYHVSSLGESFLLANDDYIISHAAKATVGRYIYDNQVFRGGKRFAYRRYNYRGVPSVLVTYLVNEQLNWKLVVIIPENQLFVVLKRINNTIFLFETPILVAIICASTILSLRITKPLSVLRKRLDSAEIDDGVDLALFPNNDEINALEISYNNLLQRIKELIAKNNLEKERQRELELVALQAQINPHFIYNTLDAIAWIAKLKNQDDIERLVLSLATFFRISLHRGDKYITVEEEIALIKSFVAIEQVRFPGKFNITYEIDERIYRYRMLKIIIQPIVENAIKHGIGGRIDGEIVISGEQEGDSLRFRVRDNGVGVTEIDHAKHDVTRSGYGLRNVDERIKLEYGPDCGIDFRSEPGRGTTVTIRIKALAANAAEPKQREQPGTGSVGV